MSQNTSTRRKFLGMTGLMGAGAVLSGCTAVIAATPAKKNLDAVIFNFALNLEYLEGAFYLAATGRLGELDAAGGDSSKVILPANFKASAFNGTGIAGMSAGVRAYAEETATDEKNHVAVIRAVLGSAAVSQPVLDLGPAFQAAGNAASGGIITGFDPFANELFFLHGAFIFEDVGVTAYKGAARLLVDDKPAGNLENAAGILAVEAYHAGMIRTLLYAQKDVVVVQGSGSTPTLKVSDVVQAISNFRDSVDGSDDRDQGIVAGMGNPSYVTGASNIIPTDSNSIAFSRTPRQVANIVFFGGAAKGGFYPEGISGNKVTGDYSSILSL